VTEKIMYIDASILFPSVDIRNELGMHLSNQY